MTTLLTPEFCNVKLSLNALPNESACIHFVSPVEIEIEDRIDASGNTDTFDGPEIKIFHGADQFGGIAQAGDFSCEREATSTSRDFFIYASGPEGVRHVMSNVRITKTAPTR